MKLRSQSRLVDAFEREEFEIVLFIEPCALEVLKREIHPPGEGKGVNRKLDMSVLLFPGIGLVIEDLQITVADLQEIDVAGDEVAFEVELEPAIAVISDVLLREVHRDFDGDSRGVVHEHEPLERFMALLVRDCSGEHERGKAGCIIFFTRNGNGDCRGEFG